MIETLGLVSSDNKRLSQAVREVFPSSTKSRPTMEDVKRKVFYKNIGHKIRVPEDENEQERVLFPDNSGIANIKSTLERLNKELLVVQTQLQQEVEKKSCQL